MYIVSLLFARVGVLKPVTVPEHGGSLSWRRHAVGNERGRAGGILSFINVVIWPTPLILDFSC